MDSVDEIVDPPGSSSNAEEDPPEIKFEDMLRQGLESDQSVEAIAIKRKLLPELVIAIARPQGTDDLPIRREIAAEFSARRYSVHAIKLSSLIRAAAFSLTIGANPEYRERKGFERIKDLMSLGDSFRTRISRSVAAEFAVFEIQRIRDNAQFAANAEGMSGVVYMISSIVHPAEVSLLRSVYKQRFFLTGIHQSYDERLRQLERKLHHDGSGPDAKSHAIQLLEIDAGSRTAEGTISDASLNIDATFHKADVFVRARRPGLKSNSPSLEY